MINNKLTILYNNLDIYMNNMTEIVNQKESETRDLIDGLFDDENQENLSIFTIELKDIEILTIQSVLFKN